VMFRAIEAGVSPGVLGIREASSRMKQDLSIGFP